MESRAVVAWGQGWRKEWITEGRRELLPILLLSTLHVVHFPPPFLMRKTYLKMILLFCISYLHYFYIRKLLGCCLSSMVPELFLSSIINGYFTVSENLLYFFFDSTHCICLTTLHKTTLSPFKWPRDSIKMMQWRKTSLCAREKSPNKIVSLSFSLTSLVICLKFHDFKRNRLFLEECILPLPMRDLENQSSESNNLMATAALLFAVHFYAREEWELIVSKFGHHQDQSYLLVFLWIEEVMACFTISQTLTCIQIAWRSFKKVDSNSVGPGWSLRFLISKKPMSDAQAARPWSTLCITRA